MYICHTTWKDVPVCVYASTSACVLRCVYMFLCVWACLSHEGHWSRRPPDDLSYFYGEVSLASPHMPPVEGEISRSGWSAVTGAFWTHTCAHLSTHSLTLESVLGPVYTSTPPKVNVNNTYISKLTQGSPETWAGLFPWALLGDSSRGKTCKLAASL